LAKDYFFDGSQSRNGNESPGTPFNTLDAISGLKIAPGDNILLNKGTNFIGPSILSQSGTDEPTAMNWHQNPSWGLETSSMLFF
jgi:hypothetical protein